MKKNMSINQIALFVLLLPTFNSTYAKNITLEYLVPTGFSAIESHDTMRLLGIFNGKILPTKIFFSEQKQTLSFDHQQYRDNNVDEQSIILLEQVLLQIPYLQCQNGCDYNVSGYNVILDKINQVVTITNNNSRYLMPTTTWGLVHNQSFDLRMTAQNYRAMSARGNGYLGLPLQSYGFVQWFYNTTRSKRNYQFSDQSQYQQMTQRGIDSWYLQKNFQTLYLRTGKQNNLDNSAGSIHTLINPALEQFVTLGSQSYLALDKPSAGNLILYAISDGDYEIYRDNQLIRRIPAQIGRNEIDYSQLPGGYYDIDIRLVDNTGRVVSQESQAISNLGTQTNDGWFLTMGKVASRNKHHSHHLAQFGRSMKIQNVQTNISLLKDDNRHWAAEANISRPLGFSGFNITPTFSMMSGEKHGGGYLRLEGGIPL